MPPHPANTVFRPRLPFKNQPNYPVSTVEKASGGLPESRSTGDVPTHAIGFTSVHHTQAEAAAVKAFVASMRGGAVRFPWTNPDDDLDYLCIFTGFSGTRSGNGKWEFDVNLLGELMA